MNATWARRAIGWSPSVWVRAKFPQTERLGVLGGLLDLKLIEHRREGAARDN
jgi:hypothetical protein